MPSDLQVSNIKALDGTDGISIADSTGNTTLSGNLVIPDDGTIGSASDTDAITIDSSGNVLVGTTNSTPGVGDTDPGISLRGTSGAFFSRTLTDASSTAYFNRSNTDGNIVIFLKDGTSVGSIGVGTEAGGSGIYIGKSDTCLSFQTRADNAIAPFSADTGTVRDNAIDLGASVARFDDIYATNGTIQTSDRNDKQDIEELSEAEQRVAIVAKGLLRKFRWKSSVLEKGEDARIHFGIIAQDLKSAFEAEGLDAGRYGMFIHSEWWETEETYTDDDGVEKTRINTFDTEEEAPEGAVKKDRMGIRYSELLAFIIAGI